MTAFRLNGSTLVQLVRKDYGDAGQEDFHSELIWYTELLKIFCYTDKRSQTKKKKYPSMPIPNPAVYAFDRCWSASFLCLWRVGKVSRLHGSSDIQFGPPARPKSPLASTDRSRYKRDLSLPDVVVCVRWVPLLLATHKTLVVSPSSPVYMRVPLCPWLFPQQTLAPGTGQPAVDSVESQSNTGPAWQTSHLCVCMGTSGLPMLAGHRPPVSRHTLLLVVYWCCHGNQNFSTPTQVLV